MNLLTPNSFGVELREFNDCHEPAGSPKGGQFCSKAGGWTPTMTPAEADDWAKGSLVTDTLYWVGHRPHTERIRQEGFRLDRGSWRRTWGDAVYLGLDAESRDFYLKAKKDQGEDPVALRVRANVQRPLVLQMRSRTRSPKALGELVRLFPPKVRQQFERLAAERGDYESAFTQTLQQMGYDSVLITSGGTKRTMKDFTWNVSGGAQLIVFDPKRVTVVGEDAPKAKKVKTAAEWKPSLAPIDVTIAGPEGSSRTERGEELTPDLALTRHTQPSRYDTGRSFSWFVITHRKTGLLVADLMIGDSEPYAREKILDLASRLRKLDWKFSDKDAVPETTRNKAPWHIKRWESDWRKKADEALSRAYFGAYGR